MSRDAAAKGVSGMYVFTSSLHHPDDEDWKSSHGYSSAIAGVLTDAYRFIQLGNGAVQAFERAAAITEAHVKSRMSRRQRLHLYFILATAYAACDCFDEALGWIDRAIALAIQLKDVAAHCQLLSLRASVNRALLLFMDAINDRCTCLDLLDIQHAVLGVDDSAPRLQTYAQLATYAYFAGQPLLAEQSLEETRRLAVHTPHEDFDLASAEWVQAHLYHTYGEPERALHHVLAFYDQYISEASAISQDRFEFFIAEVTLDWARKLPPGTDRDALLALSLPHLETAEQLARESQDRPGQGLAQLARAHYRRLSGANAERIAGIEAVLRLGAELDDVAVVAQAYTALGDEFASSNDTASSLNCYQNTLHVLAGSQVNVLAIPARRALLIFQEMNI
jgi:hypothetical protein